MFGHVSSRLLYMTLHGQALQTLIFLWYKNQNLFNTASWIGCLKYLFSNCMENNLLEWALTLLTNFGQCKSTALLLKAFFFFNFIIYVHYQSKVFGHPKNVSHHESLILNETS